ncbi:MAG: UvrD-helicase domain-containing protein [Lachnospiraceae bacterium]|nr:UvrD-helicase domain-containing protein [Lachnospiraceae bacterium]
MAIYDKLNDKQQEAVFCTKGPLLILAGAGSGKTSVLTHRAAYLLDEVGVKPYNILAITFTNKAAQEMRERIDKLIGFGSDQIFVSTFHSMCVRILRRHVDLVGYSNNFTIYDNDDQKSIMKEVCKKLEIDTKKIKERSILNQISSAKNELVGPEKFAMGTAGDYILSKVAACYAEYQATLHKNNAFDFDDLIMKTVELFTEHPEVLENYHERWQYIMVDEYQDTNTAQFELVRLLASGSRNICVVGDDDQSIYKFRGANIRNILDFEKHYPDAKVVKLEQNYRSVQTILDAANAVIRNNSSRKDKSLWSKNGEGDKIHFRQFDTAMEEAEYVASDVLRSVRKDGFKFSDSAVLYRTNSQSRMLEERFVRENIPYRIVGGINFYSRREIKDLIAYLKTVDNGADDLSTRRIINIPKRGLGATSVTKVQMVADEMGISFFDALSHLDRAGIKGSTADKLRSFESMILRLRAINQAEGPVKLIKEILDVTDYINQMEVESEEEADERIGNIEELVSKITAYCEEHAEPTLTGLLEEIALIADIDSVTEGEDRVLLMTIHSAKGLEFTNVYLTGMEDGLFPSFMSVTEGDEGIEEERRLAYVAITRAKRNLTISSARARMINGETQYNAVSRFVNEIPNSLFDTPPVRKKQYGEDYSEDRYEGTRSFRSFDSGFSRKSDYSDEGDTYGGFKRTADEPSAYDISKPYNPYSRPKASARKTPEEDKPFIVKAASLDNLKKGSDIAAGGSSKLKAGDRVRHVKFGDGTVISVVKETRDDKVTVQFDTAGQKIMYASFARLQII